MRLRTSILLLLTASVGVVAEQGAEQPRFRGGANLVRIDAYVSKGGSAVTDLNAEDIELLEDDAPQQLESFELVTRGASAQAARRFERTTVAAAWEAASDPNARLFTLFFDAHHAPLEGSYRSQNSVVQMLEKAVREDDFVGGMNPAMSALNVVFAHRPSGIERFVNETWNRGIRRRIDKREDAEGRFLQCYPLNPDISNQMILRRRQQLTFDALNGLMAYLEGLRPDRKFVFVVTEGWQPYKPEEVLARALDASDQSRAWCDTQRATLANIDHGAALRQLLERANRANVSFFPVDARQLVDVPSVDQTGMRARHEVLRSMAVQTNGAVVLSSNDVGGALQRVLADLGSYYVMSYYSSNTNLDGRFRRISMRVKRDGVDVRARKGYLAPTESEARAAGVLLPGRTSLLTPVIPPTVTRPLDALGAPRGTVPVRIQATGGAGAIRAFVELDPIMLKLPEWAGGGEMRFTIEGERGRPHVATTVVEPGQKSITAVGPSGATLAPGRYTVRADLSARGGRAPFQATTFVAVPAETATVGTGALALRRGPSTGLAYQPTADSRFRRTERIRIELPVLAQGVTTTGRLLNRDARPMPLTVTTSERVEGTMRLAVAEVVLAPLAAGEYVIELSCAAQSGTETVAYAFRIVP